MLSIIDVSVSADHKCLLHFPFDGYKNLKIKVELAKLNLNNLLCLLEWHEAYASFGNQIYKHVCNRLNDHLYSRPFPESNCQQPKGEYVDECPDLALGIDAYSIPI